MNSTGHAFVTVFVLAAIAAVSVGGYGLGTGRLPLAAAAYTVATLLLAAVAREANRAAAAPAAARPRPGRPLARLRACLQARRATRTPCGCDRYWTSAGTAHDDWCLMHDGSETS
ncbi:hypothetical protein [Streptomyces sp. NRRL B-1347]|uniref:hypothetical protein n=1 Tax=Streptomyces sp. NRRL B-1347 TaxID=1476877 RepID=UPI0004C9BF65|nr:hypothetical protein [Streptomyces sp. NRRL B-1347]